MGRASRTKWAKRVRRPLDKVKHIDPAKLAHHAMLESRRMRATQSPYDLSGLKEYPGD